MGAAPHDLAADVSGIGPLRLAPHAPAVPLRQRIYESVRAAGHLSRAALAKELQVSPGSVTPVVSDLLGAGLLREVAGAAPSGRGRPPVTLAIAPEAGLAVGVKLSDREISAVLVDLAGTPVAQGTAPRDPADRDPEAAIAAIAALVERLLAGCGGRVVGAGVGLPGMVHGDTGRLHWSPVLEGRDVPFGERLAARLGVPVAIDNDAACLTVAELWFGRGRALPDFAVVTIEYGVGMGLVIGHRPWRGARGLGMELGHTRVHPDGALCRCGGRGCLEAYVADYALVRDAALVLESPVPEGGDVLDALLAEARGGNAAARAIFERAARHLAVGLANVANLFEPRRIILSGSRMRYDLLWAEGMLDTMAAMVLADPPPVEVNAWDDGVWARGAAALALDRATPGLLA
ncbi:ROK family protein [Jannaschia sp. W003]|uniref:ROK family protein n=1 Tax=Jannaschia sp. W003 TaxID=2867012 RepID=UPI0021A6F8B7|nr:ROK family protein [Jannaschia sp. W003]UWQ21937.1 ROK family protein [Jannaschia sp. W003]